MKICRIQHIKPDGKPWESQYGLMYPFYVSFADGAAGTVNSKTEVPAYKVGDEVGYEITGATPRGVPKLKIDRKADPAQCQNTTPQDYHPDLEAAQPVSRPPGAREASFHTQTAPSPIKPSSGQGNAVHGATACWSVGKAVEIWIATTDAHSPTGQDIDTIEAIARDMLAIQGRLERGEPQKGGEANVPF